MRSGTAPHLLTFYAQLVDQVKVPAADIRSDELYNLGLGTTTPPTPTLAPAPPTQPGSAVARLSLAERCGSPPRKTTKKKRWKAVFPFFFPSLAANFSWWGLEEDPKTFLPLPNF